MIDYNIDLLTNVISYNKSKYLAFRNGEDFLKNIEFERILNARYQKVSRIKKRLLFLFTRYEYIYFATFTFSDKYINKCERTKRDLIKSSLNQLDIKYILNIDYGKTTQRQHFHAILATNSNLDLNSFLQKNYKGGYCLSILCKNGLNDFKRLSKYINKLVNHCIKATTNKQRLVYNFKGYDTFCPDSRTKTIIYDLEYEKYFKNVSLLDKADINGNLYDVENEIF